MCTLRDVCFGLVIAISITASTAQTTINAPNPNGLNGYLPPVPSERSHNTADDAHLNVRLLTNAISSVLAEQTPPESAIQFPTDDYEDIFAGTTRLDDRFATLNEAHVQRAQQEAERRMTTATATVATTSSVVSGTAETTARRFIEGLPAAEDDFMQFEGSSVADGERIDPNLVKTLLG